MRSSVNTIQGQAWDQISRAAFGTELSAGDVIAVNADEADVLLLSGGQTVALPELPASEAAKGIARSTTILPPWSRNRGN